MDFYSPLLKEMPKAQDVKQSRFPKRAIIISIIALFIAIPVIVIATRLLPPNGSGYPFYWLHDHVYLPIKAYSYKLFFPFSLSWWGPIITAFVIWLTAFLTRSAILKNPHTFVLKKIVRRRSKHRFLVNTGKWLKKRKFNPLLMREVTSAEREKALVKFIALGISKTDDQLTRRLVALTGFHARLLTLPHATQQNHMEAALIWHKTYLHVRARHQFHPDNKILDTETSELAKMLEFIAPAMLDLSDSNKLASALRRKSGFDLPGITLDLLYLCALSNSDIADAITGSATAANPALLKKAVIARLADSMEKRTTLLENIHSRIESGEIVDQTVFPYLSGQKDSSFFLCATGALSLSIAMDLAVLSESVPLALSYMEIMEILDFLLHSLVPTEDRDTETAYIKEIKTLVQLPDRGFYRLCAELSEKDLADFAETWKQSAFHDRGPILPTDMQLAQTRIRALYHAAGPELDKMSHRPPGVSS